MVVLVVLVLARVLVALYCGHGGGLWCGFCVLQFLLAVFSNAHGGSNGVAPVAVVVLVVVMVLLPVVQRVVSSCGDGAGAGAAGGGV